MKRNAVHLLTMLASVYLIICILLFFFQESIIFHPEKLPPDFEFIFNQEFEEIYIDMEDDIQLNGLLFKADSSQGLIFYLHGNAGSVRSWGTVAEAYTNLNYDVFMLDYRGFGKSEGNIASQNQLLSDLQLCYDKMKLRYGEDQIIVLGYSIGSGPGAWLSAKNQPRGLILQAPYFSLVDMKNQTFPWLPSFLLKYRLETYRYIQDCTVPIVIFHGDDDQVIPYTSSIKLQNHLKPGDLMITLEGQGHNSMSYNPVYIEHLDQILTRE